MPALPENVQIPANLDDILDLPKQAQVNPEEVFGDEFADTPAVAHGDFTVPGAENRPMPQLKTQPQSEPAQESNDSGAAENAQALKDIVEAYKVQKAAEAFMNNHPEYQGSELGCLAIRDYLDARKLAYTYLNLELAHSALTGAAPLQSVPEPKAPVVPQKPVQTGLSDRPGEAPKAEEASLQDIAAKMQTMSLEQARRYMSTRMLNARQRKG